MLRYAHAFCILSEELHFGRAATRLNITQPALSHQIKMIEQSVGCRLFDRSPHGVALTEAGAGLALELAAALSRIARAREVAIDVARGNAGALSIGYCELPWSGRLPRIVQLYAARFPGMQVSLKPMPTNEQANCLLSGALDVAFLHPPIDEAGLVLRQAGSEPMVAALLRDHPLAGCPELCLSLLSREQLIVCSEHSAPHLHRALARSFARCGVRPRLSMIQDSWHAMAAGALAGLGVALVPQSMCRSFPADLIFKPLADLDYVLETALVTKAEPWRPAVAHFVAIAAAVFADPG
jgi:DNA-binding transcriptional LysR family regulator